MLILLAITTPEATCAVLDCDTPLAYIRGKWTHVPEDDGCDSPEPVTCAHEADWGCTQVARLDLDRHVYCLSGYPHGTCCGCCNATAQD